MKKFIKAAAVLLAVFALTACGGKDKKYDGRELISLIPIYNGETVTDTHHEFTKDDFKVMLTFKDGNDEFTDDFTFEVDTMKDGYYFVNIYWEDVKEVCYVPIELDIWH